MDRRTDRRTQRRIGGRTDRAKTVYPPLFQAGVYIWKIFWKRQTDCKHFLLFPPCFQRLLPQGSMLSTLSKKICKSFLYGESKILPFGKRAKLFVKTKVTSTAMKSSHYHQIIHIKNESKERSRINKYYR